MVTLAEHLQPEDGPFGTSNWQYAPLIVGFPVAADAGSLTGMQCQNVVPAPLRTEILVPIVFQAAAPYLLVMLMYCGCHLQTSGK